MKEAGIRKYVLRTLLALAPIAAYVALYAALDPFGVVHPYDGVSLRPGDTLEHIPNKRYVAVEALEYYRGVTGCDSFIFGSSLSTNYTAAAWKRHLPDTAGVYHFTAGSETLVGIRDELRYLFDRGMTVSHAMLVMEEEMFRRQGRYGDMPSVPHYAVSPEVTWLDFHLVHFNAFRDPELFLYSIWPSLVADRAVAHGKVQRAPSDGHDELTNEDRYDSLDSAIISDPDAYYGTMPWLVEMRPQPNPMPLVITGEAEGVLRQIAAMLAEHHVDYLVIVPPRFRTQGLQQQDLTLLREIMGQERVHDFSNDSAYIHDLHCYYDGVHMLTPVCTGIIDRCYRE